MQKVEPSVTELRLALAFRLENRLFFNKLEEVKVYASGQPDV